MGSLVVTKKCIKCGKIEQMASSLDLCLVCRLKEKQEKTKSRKAQYYVKNKEKIRDYARKYYHKNKTITEDGKKDGNNFLSRKITVHFEKTEGGYFWKAYFRNPVTDRLVKFESGRYFKNLKEARDDYYEAVR